MKRSVSCIGLDSPTAKTLTFEVGLEDSDVLSRSVLSNYLLGYESEKSGDGGLDEHCGGKDVSRYGFVGYSGM